MALAERGRLLGRVALGDQVVGGRGGVGQDHIGLALQEHAVGLGPALGDRHDMGRQPFPDFLRAVAIGGFDPQQQTKAGRRTARILNHDFQIVWRVYQFFEAARRIFKVRAVVNEGEIAPVVRYENRVAPVDRHVERSGWVFHRFEQTGFVGPCRQIGVQAQNDVGLGPVALQLYAGQQRRSVARRNQVKVAVAGRLERLFHAGAGAPVGNEAVIGVDCQLGLVLRDGTSACRKYKGRSDQGYSFHHTLLGYRRG